MTRFAALAVLVALSTTACTMSHEAKQATIIGGVLSTAVGGFVYAQGPVDADHNGINENPFDDNWAAYGIGSLLLTGGVAMLLAGLVAPEDPHEHDPKVAVAPLPASTFVARPLSTPLPGEEAAPVASAPRVALPELPASAEVLTMAQQIRALSGDGHCAAAWGMWHRLDVADHTYAIALRDGGSMRGCPSEPSAMSMR